MLESVFFVTLGISCVLLMLLIYHFKQRLTKLEQSSETMFELLNNIVSELSGIKQTVINEQNPNAAGYSMMMHPTHKIPVTLSDNESEENSLPELIENIQITKNNDEGDESEDESEEEDDSDDESEEEEDDSDDESEEEEEEDDSDDESEHNETHNENESENKSITEEQSGEVKVVTVDIDNSISNDVSSDIDNVPEDLTTDSLDEPEVQPVEIDTEKIEEVHVNKLDITDDLEETASQQTTTSNSVDVYKKMNVPSLKSLVIEKGLSSDPSKMKKNELIALLETNI
jgi:hypothetical protein